MEQQKKDLIHKLWPENTVKRLSSADFRKVFEMLRGDGSPLPGFGALPHTFSDEPSLPEGERK